MFSPCLTRRSITPHFTTWTDRSCRRLPKPSTSEFLSMTLDFTYHIRETVSKANKRLGFLKRNLKKSPLPMKKLAYISLVRSGLEYAAMIWDPHLATQTKSIEQVQHRAIRWIQGVRPHQMCSITQLRKEFELQTLEERKLQQRLIFFQWCK